MKDRALPFIVAASILAFGAAAFAAVYVVIDLSPRIVTVEHNSAVLCANARAIALASRAAPQNDETPAHFARRLFAQRAALTAAGTLKCQRRASFAGFGALRLAAIRQITDILLRLRGGDAQTPTANPPGQKPGPPRGGPGSPGPVGPTGPAGPTGGAGSGGGVAGAVTGVVGPVVGTVCSILDRAAGFC